MKILCELGCGAPAINQLKNGRWICSKSVNQCEALKKKQSTKGITRPNFCGENHPRPMLGKKTWNAGLTKENDERVRLSSELRKGIVPECAGHAPTKELEEIRRKKISDKMKLVGGGFRMRSGRGKKGWYKGYYCSSSWELAWVIYSLEHGVHFTRNTEGFEYEFNGKKKKYYPDFITRDSYVEIKGYDSPQWESKKKQFTHSLKIIDKKEITQYIDYVIGKYGKDYIKLYE